MTDAIAPTGFRQALAPVFEGSVPNLAALNAVLVRQSEHGFEDVQPDVVWATLEALDQALARREPDPWLKVLHTVAPHLSPESQSETLVQLLENLIDLDLHATFDPYHQALEGLLSQDASGVADRVIRKMLLPRWGQLAPHLPLLLPHTSREATGWTIVMALHFSRYESAQVLWAHHGIMDLPVVAYCTEKLTAPNTSAWFLYATLETALDEPTLAPSLRAALWGACRALRPHVAEDRYRAADRQQNLAGRPASSPAVRRPRA